MTEKIVIETGTVTEGAGGIDPGQEVERESDVVTEVGRENGVDTGPLLLLDSKEEKGIVFKAGFKTSL